MNAIRISGIFGGVLVLVMALIIIANNLDADSQHVTGTTSFPLGTDDSDVCVKFDTDLTSCLEYGKLSIIEPDIKLAESDSGVVDNFLESIDKKFEQFGIEIVSVKYNLAGDSQSFSSVFPVQLFSANLVNNDFPVDNVQIAFNAITKDEYSQFNLEGIVDFVFDGKVVATKKLWSSSSLANQKTVALKVVDSIPPPLNKRPETFDFTFTDEQFAIGDKDKIPELEALAVKKQAQIDSPIVSEDAKKIFRYDLQQIEAELDALNNNYAFTTFQVVLKSLKGDYTANGEKKMFDWHGEFIAYTLNLTINESQKSILDEQGNVIAVYKNDDRVVSCSVGKYTISWWNSQTGYLSESIDATPSLKVEVIDSNGKSIGRIESFITNKIGSKADSSNPATSVVVECKTIEGLARNTEYILKINDDEIKIQTPNEQHNYNIQYMRITAYGGSPTPKIYVNCGGASYCSTPSYSIAVPNGAIYKKAVTNFGYNYNTVPCEGAKTHYAGISTYTAEHILPVSLSYSNLPVEIQAGCRK